MQTHKTFADLLGKKIVAYRGCQHRKSKYSKEEITKLQYILFEDGIIMELREQDPYDYHDCSNSARNITIYQNQELWQRMFDKEKYQEPDQLNL